MGQTASSHVASPQASGGSRWCKGEMSSVPDKSRDTVRINMANELTKPSTEQIKPKSNFGCSGCTIVTSREGAETPATSSSASVVPCPSVVVTDVSTDSATVRWSCPQTLIVSKYIVEVLLELMGSSMESESTDAKTVGTWQVDGITSTFRIPPGTLQCGFGPYCVRVTAEAGPSKKGTGVSATFFTKDEVLDAVTDLCFTPHVCKDSLGTGGCEIDLQWHQPEKESCAIQDYRVNLQPSAGGSRSFTVHKTTARISLLDSDFDAKLLHPVVVEVCARSFTGALGKVASIEIPPDALQGEGVRPVSAGSSDEPLAEPPSANEAQQVASPWLGVGWEHAFVVQARAAFEPTGSDMLFVRKGDSIQVLEQHDSGWAYCKNLSVQSRDADSAGWVPNWVVKSKSGTAKSKVKM